MHADDHLILDQVTTGWGSGGSEEMITFDQVVHMCVNEGQGLCNVH